MSGNLREIIFKIPQHSPQVLRYRREGSNKIEVYWAMNWDGDFDPTCVRAVLMSPYNHSPNAADTGIETLAAIDREEAFRYVVDDSGTWYTRNTLSATAVPCIEHRAPPFNPGLVYDSVGRHDVIAHGLDGSSWRLIPAHEEGMMKAFKLTEAAAQAVYRKSSIVVKTGSKQDKSNRKAGTPARRLAPEQPSAQRRSRQGRNRA